MPNLFFTKSGPFYSQLVCIGPRTSIIQSCEDTTELTTVAPNQWTTMYPLSHLPLGFLPLYAIQQPA